MLNLNKLELNPQDGFGCGRSLHWEYEGVQMATKLGENCEHLDIHNILIKMIPEVIDSNYFCKCKVKCAKCDAKFKKTTEQLTEKFLKFYGR